MSSRRLTFDASRPSTRNLGASPAARNTLLSTSQSPALLSPTRGLATPTRAAQRASLSRPPYSGSLGRRNPLQAITDKERERSNHQQQHRIATPNATPRGAVSGTDVFKAPHHTNENAAPSTRAAACPTPEQQRDQNARIAEWVFAYRRAFPSFVFYFEGVDESTVRRLSAPIRVLGAKIETFFSAQAVTHVIVDDISKISDENGAGSSHVVSLAKRFQLKIWDLAKLETRILAYILPGHNDIATQSPSMPSVKRKLNEAFSAEKMYAMRHKTFEGTSVAHSVDFYYFKYYYVLVEDGTHLSRPAILEDYRPPEPGNDPPWPKLYMVPKGRCPFIQYDDPTTSSKGSESDPEYNKENLTPEPEDTLPTVHLLSKTPASRTNTPRRKTWAPS
ncbi:Cdc7p-Dbf4p kinase complex regulatory subunit, partial [Coemansia sp. IMI 209127]